MQLAASCVLRQVLVMTFAGTTVPGVVRAAVLMAGTAIDLLAGLTAALPWLLLLSLFRVRWMQRPQVQHAIVAAAGAVLAFEACVQYFFFEGYSGRYNHLALDYLLYPDEVLGNIFASYDVPLFVGLAIVAGMALALVTASWPRAVVDEWDLRDRLKGLALTGGLAVIACSAWLIVPDSVVGGRVANELAINGWAQRVRAYLTAHLDYEAYYAMLRADDAAAHLRRLVSQPSVSGGLLRHFEPQRHGSDGPLDVVVIIEESFGSGNGIVLANPPCLLVAPSPANVVRSSLVPPGPLGPGPCVRLRSRSRRAAPDR